MSVRWLCLCVLLGCGAREPASVVQGSEASVSAPAPAGAAAVVAANLPAERMVIREAELQLRTQDPRKAADAAARIATEAGGFVLGSELSAVDAHASVIELQLRVPQPALDATLARIRKLGTLLSENVSGQDVTEEFVDVSARLRAQRALETRLLSLLERSAELKDLLLVEQELARVRGEIEQREGRLQYLKERSRMAAIKLVAQAPEQPLVASVQSLGSRFTNAAERSVDLALTVTEWMIQLVGFAAPLALLTLALVSSWRGLRRLRLARGGVAASA